jgi:hypothetical protein
MRSAFHLPRSGIDRLSRRSRRIIATATVLGLPGMFAWSALWHDTQVPPILWGPGTFVLIGVTIAGAFVLYRYVRDRADLPGEHLDERERQLRDRAWILAYQVLAMVVVLVAVAVVLPVLGLGRTITIDASVATAITLCLGVLLPLLPAAALAWLEPDRIEER